MGHCLRDQTLSNKKLGLVLGLRFGGEEVSKTRQQEQSRDPKNTDRAKQGLTETYGEGFALLVLG